MLDTQKGEILFCCDGCSEVLSSGTGNFEAARNMLKREQWTPVKVGDDWTHYCPGCKRR